VPADAVQFTDCLM